MESYIILGLLIHFLADFGLQTHEQATLKSNNDTMLLYHVGVYSLVWFIFMLCFLNPILAFIFSMITFWMHYATDYITSRISKKFFSKEDFHNGFVVVGFDQLLHYIQLFYTYKFILTKQ